jgi:hypothetical protein
MNLLISTVIKALGQMGCLQFFTENAVHHLLILCGVFLSIHSTQVIFRTAGNQLLLPQCLNLALNKTSRITDPSVFYQFRQGL